MLPQACFPGGSRESPFVYRFSPMHDATAIHGHDIIQVTLPASGKQFYRVSRPW